MSGSTCYCVGVFIECVVWCVLKESVMHRCTEGHF